jgi:alpha-L-fucosidase
MVALTPLGDLVGELFAAAQSSSLKRGVYHSPAVNEGGLSSPSDAVRLALSSG